MRNMLGMGDEEPKVLWLRGRDGVVGAGGVTTMIGTFDFAANARKEDVNGNTDDTSFSISPRVSRSKSSTIVEGVGATSSSPSVSISVVVTTCCTSSSKQMAFPFPLSKSTPQSLPVPTITSISVASLASLSVSGVVSCVDNPFNLALGDFWTFAPFLTAVDFVVPFLELRAVIGDEVMGEVDEVRVGSWASAL